MLKPPSYVTVSKRGFPSDKISSVNETSIELYGLSPSETAILFCLRGITNCTPETLVSVIEASCEEFFRSATECRKLPEIVLRGKALKLAGFKKLTVKASVKARPTPPMPVLRPLTK